MDHSITVGNVVAEFDFNASQDVVSDLEILKSDLANVESDGSIPAILKTGEVAKHSRNQRVLPVGITLVGRILNNRHAWESPGNEFVENTKTIAAV
jgi:hypothetical protein